MKLTVSHLSWKVGTNTIVNNLSFNVMPGEFIGIIGPNGSGKTSLISLLAGIRKPNMGEIKLGNKVLQRYSRREIAQRLALVEQQADTTERLTGRQVVELGRTPHLSAFSPWSCRDNNIVDDALKAVNMNDLSERNWQTLSGGERQRLHIARAIAQEPKVLLLDEPTNHLDIHHQIALLHLVREQKLTVVAALHDLNHAAMFCDRIVMLQKGNLVALGTPKEILTTKRIYDVFDVTSIVMPTDDNSCYIRFKK